MPPSSLTINSETLAFEPGQTILTVARNSGIKVPTLCDYKDTRPTGSCRICVGEVEGARTLLQACANWLTNPAFDPVSQTAEYKACAVRLETI